MATNFELLQAKLEADPDFAEKLIELETAEDAQSFLQAEGLDFTVEELNSFADAVNRYGESEGELSDEALEGVAGGTAIAAVASTITSINNEINRATGRVSSAARRVMKRYFRSW